jgi:hypothetical protein
MSNTNEQVSSLSGLKRSSEKDPEVLQDAETAEPIQKQLKLDHTPAANANPGPSQIAPVTNVPMSTPLSQGKLDNDVNTQHVSVNSSLTPTPIHQ